MSTYKTLMQAIDGNDYLILDTDTTGLHEGEIVSIAIINQDGETLLDSFVKPFNGIPIDSTRIHGITEDTVKYAPTWPELVPQIKDILDGKILVVYNAIFDRKMMHQSWEAAGNTDKIEWKAISQWHCAMLAYAEFFGDWNSYHQSYRWQRLSNAPRTEKVKVENAHNALGKCLMTLGVVKSMLQSYREDRS